MSAQLDGVRGIIGSREMDDSNHLLGELGNERSPFDDSHSLYYPVKQWEEHFRFLHAFRAGSQPLLLMPGIVGSGKTALIKHFLELQNDSARVHYIEAQPHHDVNHLILDCYTASRLEARADASIPEMLHQFSLLANEIGSQLLFIDDAHRLPRETLMRFLHLLFTQDLSQSQFRVVLVGESQLQETVMNMLDSFAPGRQVPCLEIESLSLQEVREYLEFRFSHANANQKFPFNSAVLKQIHLLSGGFPGRINRVAQQVFVDSVKFDHRSEEHSVPFIQYLQGYKMKLIGATSLVILFLLMWQFYPMHHSNSGEISALRSALNTTTEKTQQEAQDSFNDETVADASAANSGQLSPDVRAAIAAAVDHLQATELSEADQYEESFSMPLVHNQHLCAGAKLADENVYLANKPSTESNSVKTETQVAANDAVVDQNTTAKIEKSSLAMADSVTGAELQLMAAKGFTIQIMGVRAPQLLETFIAENHLTEAMYYRTKLNQQNWYVLVYGNYQNADDAKAALVKLPDAVKRQQPWVRSFDGVRQAIEVAHQKEVPKEAQTVAVR